MKTLSVERVDPYSPGDESASVTLRSVYGEIVVFCYPCQLAAGDRIENHLSALDAKAQAAYLPIGLNSKKKKDQKKGLRRLAHMPIEDAGVCWIRLQV